MSEQAQAQAADAATIEPTLIRHGRIEADTWQRFEPSDAAPLPADDGHWIVSLAVWKASHAALRDRKNAVGILLEPADDPRELAANDTFDARGVALLAVDFPVYTDGRGYSIAQILRTRLGWKGELRAMGDVMIDTIHYQARCGFDSFLLKAGHDPQKALKAFQLFSVHYQQTYPKPMAA